MQYLFYTQTCLEYTLTNIFIMNAVFKNQSLYLECGKKSTVCPSGRFALEECLAMENQQCYNLDIFANNVGESLFKKYDIRNGNFTVRWFKDSLSHSL